MSAAASWVQLIEEPLAGAIGAGAAIEPTGRMVVDVGGGTVRGSGAHTRGNGRLAVGAHGGYDLDGAIISHIRLQHRLAIGGGRGEELKSNSARLDRSGRSSRPRCGRDLTSGLPKQITLDTKELRAALDEPVQRIIAAVRETFELTPRVSRLTSSATESFFSEAELCSGVWPSV